MYRVALCEDEEFFLDEQKKICREVLENLNIEYSIAVFESSVALWSEFSNGARFDFILLDIVMDETNGIELARKMREHDKDMAIVFITVNPDFALLGYEVRALHYLLKPLNSDKLKIIINSDYECRFKSRFFMVKAGAQNLRIPVKDIVCFETVGRRVEITLLSGGVNFTGKLTEVLVDLPREQFIRCHVGYIINLKNINKLTRTEAISVDGKIIPISRVYSSEVQKAFLKQMWES